MGKGKRGKFAAKKKVEKVAQKAEDGILGKAAASLKEEHKHSVVGARPHPLCFGIVLY